MANEAMQMAIWQAAQLSNCVQILPDTGYRVYTDQSNGSILGSVCRASTVRMLVDQQAQLEYWRVQHCLSAASVEGTEVPQVEDEDRDSSTTGG